MHGTQRTRLLRIEGHQRPAAAVVVDSSPWDMFGDRVEKLVDRLGRERQDPDRGLGLDRARRMSIVDHPLPVLEVHARRGVVRGHQVFYSFPAPIRLISSSPGAPNEYNTPVDFLGKKSSWGSGENSSVAGANVDAAA